MTYNMVELFPLYTLYVFVFSLIAGFFLLMAPAPYGKFATNGLPLQFNPRLTWVFIEIGAFICVLLGWTTFNGVWHMEHPTTTKGWICFIFFLVHYSWRSILSSVVLHSLTNESDREIVGDKETSLLLAVFSWLYLPVVGFMIRKMTTQEFEALEGHELIFLLAAAVCFILNVWYDVWINSVRAEKGEEMYCGDLYLGKYVSIDYIGEYWYTVVGWGISTPNYFFECLEWGFFALFSWKIEAFWWFVACLCHLTPRMMWYNDWYAGKLSGSCETDGLRASPILSTAVTDKSIRVDVKIPVDLSKTKITF
jgi:hypothetical protein